MRTTFLLLTTAILFVSCSKLSNQDIRENTNKKLKILLKNNNKKIFVSNIYKDKELGEVFLEKLDEDIIQITNDKQNISVLLLDKQRNGVIYGQSKTDGKPLKLVESLATNTPSRFSDYRIVFYNFNNNTKKVLSDISKEDIIGIIQNMSFLDNGKTLAFQTHYGEIFFLDLDHPQKPVKFIPATHYPSQFKFDSFWKLKTDGNKNLIFEAVCGYKSETDESYVYNTFKYNLETHEVEKISDAPFYYSGE